MHTYYNYSRCYINYNELLCVVCLASSGAFVINIIGIMMGWGEKLCFNYN